VNPTPVLFEKLQNIIIHLFKNIIHNMFVDKVWLAHLNFHVYILNVKTVSLTKFVNIRPWLHLTIILVASAADENVTVWIAVPEVIGFNPIYVKDCMFVFCLRCCACICLGILINVLNSFSAIGIFLLYKRLLC